MTNVFVKRIPICASNCVVYGAYSPAKNYEGFSSFMSVNGESCGRVGTESLPKELAMLPAFTDERYKAVKAFHAMNYERAYAAILAEYPHLKDARRDMGEISEWVENERG